MSTPKNKPPATGFLAAIKNKPPILEPNAEPAHPGNTPGNTAAKAKLKTEQAPKRAAAGRAASAQKKQKQKGRRPEATPKDVQFTFFLTAADAEAFDKALDGRARSKILRRLVQDYIAAAK